MVKMETSQITEAVKDVKRHVEVCMAVYQRDYADYGMDDISNDFIGVISYLEQIRLKLQYALVKGDDKY